MNTKNPMPFWFQRMASSGMDAGTLAKLMQKWFADNYGITDLPKTVADFAIYDQQPMSAGITRLFQGQYTNERSNMPSASFILPQSEHAIILGYKMLEASVPGNTPLNKANWSPGVSDAIAKNATLDIQLNTTRVTSQLPLTVFDSAITNGALTGATNENRGFYWLAEPLAWLGQTTLQANISLIAGTDPTEDLALRFELHGIRFIGS